MRQNRAHKAPPTMNEPAWEATCKGAHQVGSCVNRREPQAAVLNMPKAYPALDTKKQRAAKSLGR